jgi:hypothetical protein
VGLKEGKKQMSFAAAENSVQREGYSKKSAGAIIAKASRNASPAAKRGNPNLAKVKGAPSRSRKHMEIEETDNGGFISKTTNLQPRDPDKGYQPNPIATAQHGSVRALQSHIRKTFPPRKKPNGAAPPSQFEGVASKMLGNSY